MISSEEILRAVSRLSDIDGLRHPRSGGCVGVVSIRASRRVLSLCMEQPGSKHRDFCHHPIGLNAMPSLKFQVPWNLPYVGIKWFSGIS